MNQQRKTVADAWAPHGETAIDAENTKSSKKGENMEEINRARAKITDESQKIGGALAIFIEEHVNKACTNEAVAKSVQEKSLKDLIKKIEDEARKNRTGNVGCVSDEEVKEMADEFYGLSAKTGGDVIDVLDLI